MRPSGPVFLVGFMGCGKSSVGRILADRNHWDYFDIDRRVEADAGQTIPQIFAESGEAEFRRLEWSALQKVGAGPSVVATGGGLFAVERARRFMLDAGITVWLDAPLSVLRARVQDGCGRPLWLESDPAKLSDIYSMRNIEYAKSHFRVDATTKAGEVAESVQVLISSVFR